MHEWVVFQNPRHADVPLSPLTSSVNFFYYNLQRQKGIMPAPVFPECDALSEICRVDVDVKIAGKLRFQAGAFTIRTTNRRGKLVTNSESVARLMLQGTFGVSTDGIDAVLNDFGGGAGKGMDTSDDTATTTMARWVAAEVLKEPTYLRQRYRRNTNPRLYPGGDHYQYDKCDVGARLHLYSFNWFDKGVLIQMVASAAGVFRLFVDGILRTEVAKFMTYTWAVGHEDKEFYICQVYENSNPLYDRSNANLHVYPTDDPNGSCGTYNGWSHGHKGPNPVVHFINPRSETTQVYEAADIELAKVRVGSSRQGVYYVKSRSNNAVCDAGATSASVSFIGVKDASGSGAVTYYKFESRLKLVTNTIGSPIAVDSHAHYVDVHRGATACTQTPKTFINYGKCVQRMKAICHPLIWHPGTVVTLDAETIRKWYTSSHKYVHVVTGLRLEESSRHRFSPCKQGYFSSYEYSRWMRAAGYCPADAKRLDSGTERVILAALAGKGIRKGATKDNANILDIQAWDYVNDNGGVCDQSENAIAASVDLDGDCWTHSHPHERNVYDCSQWVIAHPGNLDARNWGHRNPIAKQAQQGKHEIKFPSSFHRQSRWDDSNLWFQSNFVYLGKWLDEVDFSALPTSVQTREMADAIDGASEDGDHDLVFEACGSRGEVANEPANGHSYLFGHFINAPESGLDRGYNYWFDGPTNIWQNVVLRADDQLRHRVAWALSQIIVATPAAYSESEPATVFYDIFVGRAFDNYRGLIREIAQNGIMGTYLTFAGNKKHTKGIYPDENFSREVMQLFTIGLYELNMDGTQKLNAETGYNIPTYTNVDIMSFARVWTGWNLQLGRTNVQNGAYVDPMKVVSADRDTFPKTSLGTGYLGDGYPLCNEQPRRAFLLKGAHYHKTGSQSSLAQSLAYDEMEQAGTIRSHFTPNPSTSKLYAALCSKNGQSGKCTFPMDVNLPATVPCTGKVECNADILHVVKMIEGDNVEYYQYMEPTCVDFQFFNSGKLMSYNSKHQCADPDLPMRAGVACCTREPGEPLKYPAGVATVYTGGISKHHSNLFKFNIAATTVHTAGIFKEPLSFQFAGAAAKLKVKGIVRWAYNGDLLIFEPAPGVDEDDVVSFFNNAPDQQASELVVNWWTVSDTITLISSGGDQCLYLAEPTTFETAEKRCSAVHENGVLCPIYNEGSSASDGSSADWKATCSGFQHVWTNADCSWRVNIHQDGLVSIADDNDATGDWFAVQWTTKDSNSSTQQFPHPDEAKCGENAPESFQKVAEKKRCGNTAREVIVGHVDTVETCANYCSAEHHTWFNYGRADAGMCNDNGECECRCQYASHDSAGVKNRCAASNNDEVDLYKFGRRCIYLPGEGGSCLCNIDVEFAAVFTNVTMRPPAEEELRASLHIAASPPSDFETGVYTRCTTPACTSRDGVAVYTKSSSKDPATLDENTIFEIGSATSGKVGPRWARYLLNRKSVVHVGPKRSDGTLFSFRNAPTFMPSQGCTMDSNAPFNSEDFTAGRADYETTALIDHLLEHSNVAPFISIRLIQRLTTSNPSPRYVKTVATAFSTGTYAGKTYSGEYGDLEATVAAILLDREARASILDSDPYHGQLREPLLKVYHLLRGMDIKTDNDMELAMTGLYAKMGQDVFRQPSVFNFFTPDYSPEGPVADAGLYSPEAMLLSAPWTIGYMSGAALLAKENGLTSGGAAFGDASVAAKQGDFRFKPKKPHDVAAAVDEMAVVFTAGRINSNTRAVIEVAYERSLKDGGWFKMKDDNGEYVATPSMSNGKNGKNKYEAHSAIDDEKSNAYTVGGGCATATASDNAWWQVDLGRKVKVTVVKLIPRACCHESIFHGVDVEVDGVACATNLITKMEVTCELRGQVVRIIKKHGPDNTQLQLCDVAVGYERTPTYAGIYAPGHTEAEAKALSTALMLFTIVPEFHATNLNVLKETVRPETPVQESQKRPYKAIITTHLSGGIDSFNVLVPLDGCTKPKEGVVALSYADSSNGVLLTECQGHCANDAECASGLVCFQREPGYPGPPGCSGRTNGGWDYCYRPEASNERFTNREAFDLYAEYAEVRSEGLAVAKESLKPINVENQPCTRFGINENLPILQELYNDGDLLFVANMGALSEPTNKYDVNAKDKSIPSGVYGHNEMSQHCLAVDARRVKGRKGVIGRIMNTLMHEHNGEKPYKTQLYSLRGATTILEGAPGTPVYLSSVSGVVRYPQFSELEDDIANISAFNSESVFAEHYLQQINDHLAKTEHLGSKMDYDLDTPFSSHSLSQQFEQVSKAIRMDVNLEDNERAGCVRCLYLYVCVRGCVCA
jgi:uncharacterized protein (DUF1800 family)